MARPKEFVPEEALDKAMHTFWAKGYHDTSIRDLVRSTGVNQYGLYSTFTDKHGLFLAALDRYRDTVASAILSEMRGPETGLTVIRRAFDRALEIVQEANGHRGCLMCMTAVELAPHDSQAADRVSRSMALLRRGFRRAIKRAQQSGEIAPTKDPRALAEFLATTVFSAGMLMRAGQDDAYVKRHIRTALQTLI